MAHIEMLDLAQAWDAMSPADQRHFGMAAVAMMVGHIGQMISQEQADTVAHKASEIAYLEAGNILYETTITRVLGGDGNRQPPRPSLRCLGIAQCRSCGCTDECGCDGGCSWVEEDLCSRCNGVAAA